MMHENIDRKYGAVPFWFWNGDQTEEEITRQLELAAGANLRGMAVHARNGNRTEYMSPRWIELLRHTCSEARRLGLEIWIYDEENCPSGTVGLRIFDSTDFYRQKAMRFEYMSGAEAKECTGLLAVFRASDLGHPADVSTLSDVDETLVFTRIVLKENYCDTLIPETVRKFIAMTHDVYELTIGDFFGDPVTAVYTDDLNLLMIYEYASCLPFSDTLFEEFRTRCGYDLFPCLASLAEDVGEFEKVRLDFRRAVMDMFLEYFVDPMRKWCEKRNLPLTGHLSGDEGPLVKSIGRYSSAMPFFVRETVPGIDDFLTGMRDSGYLRRPYNELHHSLIATAKQVTSAAGQFNYGQCTSEVLTSLGWGVPVRQQVAQIRFQFGMGITAIVPHDFSYATAGVAKRDHPASYFYQQPYFRLADSIHAVFERSMKLIERTKYDPEILLLSPVYTAQIATNGGDMAREGFSPKHPRKYLSCDFYEDTFTEISWKLTRLHREFEYGDELLMEQFAELRGKELRLGDRSYSTVLLPPGMKLLKSTMSLLSRFAESGGTVLEVKVNALEKTTPFKVLPMDRLEEKIPDAFPAAGPEILVRSGSFNGRKEYFLVNYGKTEFELKIPEGSARIVYDPVSDCIVSAEEVVTLPPLGACHFLSDASGFRAAQKGESILVPRPGGESVPVKPVSIRPLEENVLLLDRAFLSVENRFFRIADEVLEAGKEVCFEVEIPEPEKVSGIYFESGNFESLRVNGKPLPTESSGVHPATPDLYGYSLRGMLIAGRNRFSFCSIGKRIEPLYLTGNFAVRLEGESCRMAPVSGLKTGELSVQGLPFYWGAVEYDFGILKGNSMLDFGEAEGVLEILEDGVSAGILFQSPWRIFLRKESHVIVRLYNTAQNFFGPHRRLQILGPARSWEGSSATAWTPDVDGDEPGSWGVAKFGIMGSVTMSHIDERT